jgi:CheY-like chemotaxis protein
MPGAMRYLGAIAIAAVAVALRWALIPWMGADSPFVMIRGQPWGGSVKLIALTGMGQAADLERTRVAGFDEHLTKPADPDDLFRAVATLR